MTTDILDAARRYVALGLTVIPIRKYSKHPDGQMLEITTGQPDRYGPSDSRAAWRVYTERMQTDAELHRWFFDSDCGIGIVGGRVSGGLVRLDFEHSACILTWLDLLASDIPALSAALGLPVVATLKGHHVYFRMADPPTYTILCAGLSGDDQIVLSELQGEGCYCVAPPTPMVLHNGSEARYQWTTPAIPETIPLVEAAIATRLIDAARFDDFWNPTFGSRMGILHRSGMSLRTGDALHADRIWLDWPHLASLKAYLNRYDKLLYAVETAPPAPPSYDLIDDDDGVF